MLDDVIRWQNSQDYASKTLQEVSYWHNLGVFLIIVLNHSNDDTSYCI